MTDALFLRLDSYLRTRSVRSLLMALLFATGCTSISADSRGAAQLAGLEKIHHVIVIYQENWSFDSLYGKFPGADGRANAGERIRQMKRDGAPYATLPQPLDTSTNLPVGRLAQQYTLADRFRHGLQGQALGRILAPRRIRRAQRIHRVDDVAVWSDRPPLDENTTLIDLEHQIRRCVGPDRRARTDQPPVVEE